jgi:hypothetical protein
MARRGRTPFRNQERDRRYKTIIENARQNPWGTIHKLPIPFDDETVKRHENLIWAEARYQGLGRKVTKTRNPDGSWTLSFQLWDLATSRQFVADRARRTGELHYNTRRPRRKK